MPDDLDARRKRLEQRRAKLQAEIDRLKEKERRRDARIKIILGAGLLKLARGDDGEAAVAVLRRVLAGASSREVEVLAGVRAEFPPPQPAKLAPPLTPPQPAPSTRPARAGS